MVNIEGPIIKLNRSQQHLNELQTKCDDYISSGSFNVVCNEEANDDLVYRVKIQNPVPLELSAIVGDAVHNIRSALDLPRTARLRLESAGRDH